jgi:hypothetical protein
MNNTACLQFVTFSYITEQGRVEVTLHTFLIMAQDGEHQLYLSGKIHSMHMTEDCEDPNFLHVC